MLKYQQFRLFRFPKIFPKNWDSWIPFLWRHSIVVVVRLSTRWRPVFCFNTWLNQRVSVKYDMSGSFFNMYSLSG